MNTTPACTANMVTASTPQLGYHVTMIPQTSPFQSQIVSCTTQANHEIQVATFLQILSQLITKKHAVTSTTDSKVCMKLMFLISKNEILKQKKRKAQINPKRLFKKHGPPSHSKQRVN